MRDLKKLRPIVVEQARHRCGFCQTQEVVSGIPLTLEHLFPKARGGDDKIENLWLSCRLCNELKGVSIEAVDPDTGRPIPLYNPRTQLWDDHFVWSEEGTRVIGKTPTGRATCVALDLNSELRVRARAIWVEARYHPPK